MKFIPMLLGAAAAALFTTSTLAAKLGDPAAALVIKDWAKGEPVDVKDGKNVYVVEFWATWCGPCRTSIPHLTELQKKFKDKGAIFVGVSDEPLETVKPFVEKMGEKMEYRVACDADSKTSDGYMKAFGQNGIPTAFIVGKDAKVLWFGHPMAELEETLQQILDGKYDLAAAVKKDEFRAGMDDFQNLSTAGDAKAAELGRKLLAQVGDDFDGLCDFAFTIVANTRNEHRDFKLADEALDKAATKAAGKEARVEAIRAIGRFEAGKKEEGIALAKQAVAHAKNDKEKAQYESFVQVMEQRLKPEAPPAVDKK